ncbi:helix-turn-helix domain-containing protein [Streptomyces parvus]|uniref:hypothetical protein n=1 Tax=Streptomyces parvus TaxID=66428 RepID=UPI00367CF4D2
MLVTFVHLRHATTHDVLAYWIAVDRSTITAMQERQRKARSSRRIRVEHGISRLKDWRSLARHHGRRERMSDIIQAVAGLLFYPACRHEDRRCANVITTAKPRPQTRFHSHARAH